MFKTRLIMLFLLINVIFSSLVFAAGEKLLVPIYVAVPTENSIVLSIVAAEKDFKAVLKYKADKEENWAERELSLTAAQANNVKLTDLKANTNYEYRLVVGTDVLDSGAFITKPDSVVPFSFAIMSDAHITPTNPERNSVIRAVANTIYSYHPSFTMNLGDNIQTMGSGHGGYAQDPSHPSYFYLYWRNAMGKLQSNSAQYVANGNWEGENGWHPALNQSWSETARKTFAPNPDNKTYAQGGNAKQDYYAFQWSDALFVVLNVTGYNVIDHAHTTGIGGTSDWTLGKEQYTWLEKTLTESKAKWKFIFIHHTVAGKAGDEVNSRYGRGGGLAAKIGEQAKVHELMKKTGVQVFFYGHDHVFTDIEVDGIHYICVGSAGAPWKFETNETGYTKYIPESGFTLVDVKPEKVDIKYITPSGTATGKELFNLELK